MDGKVPDGCHGIAGHIVHSNDAKVGINADKYVL
jgi:hypothetical protein